MNRMDIIRNVGVFVFAMVSVVLLPTSAFIAVMVAWLFGMIVSWTIHIEYVRGITRDLDRLMERLAMEKKIADQFPGRSNRRTR